MGLFIERLNDVLNAMNQLKTTIYKLAFGRSNFEEYQNIVETEHT